MPEPRSVLRDIAEQVQNEKDLDKAKQISIAHIKSSKMADKDNRLMLVRIEHQIFTHDKLVSFIYNNILKFEGLGVIQ